MGSWQAECRRSSLTAAAHGLDDAGVGVRGGQRVTCSLRWIYNHMIEEYARHNGHADLIRELVAGRLLAERHPGRRDCRLEMGRSQCAA